MAIWNPSRSPDYFPAVWHMALQGGPGQAVLAIVTTERQLDSIRYRFAAFRACLRAHPAHPSAKALAQTKARLVAKRGDEAIYVYLEIRPSPEALLAGTWVAKDFPPDG